MGYYSTFSVDVYDDNLNPLRDGKEFNEVVDKFRLIGAVGYALDNNLNTEQNVTWYEYQHDIAYVSTLFPYLVFRCRRVGEDPTEEIEVTYYSNGKVQRARTIITFSDFDPAQLTEINDVESSLN